VSKSPDAAGHQFHFDPDTYPDMVRAEVPAYRVFQEAVAHAIGGVAVSRILELGVGTGETSRRVLDLHPGATLVGIDESREMLDAAAGRLEGADLRVGRLEDPLPDGSFDLVVSALTVHHPDGDGKANLFGRVAKRLCPGGRFVLGDIVIPVDPSDAITPIDGVHDKPDSVADQLVWLIAVGLEPRVHWELQDLAVLVATRP